MAFFNDSHAVIQSGIANSPNRAPFKVTLAGQGFYIVTNPQDVAQVYKNTVTLSFHVFIEDLMLSCGTSPEVVRKMTTTPPPYLPDSKESGLNPQKKSLIGLAVDFHHIQLLPGPKSQVGPITDTFLGYIHNLLQWTSLLRDDKMSSSITSDNKIHTSLYQFCGKVLVEAGTKVYWGEKLWNMTPDMLQTFEGLDKTMWKILFRYPERFSKDAIQARDGIVDLLTEYYALPKETRSDAAWFTQSLEAESRAIGLTEREMASAILIIYFVVNGNTYKFCFWALCHILSDPPLLSSIRSEVLAESNEHEPSMYHLLNKCPLLDSVLCEVLRIYTSSASMRFIDEDTVIGGKNLRKGNRIMLPYRALHENPEIYGSDSLDFKAGRFLKENGMRRNNSYRPFGGGATLCAGRFVAMKEVLRFIGTALWLYDIELETGVGGVKQSFPRVENKKPTFGVMAAFGDDDLRISIKQIL
ncbi:cytochrome P450 [Lentithecium fluviatile CBS 122367]|uniref:Cytochrome P450 n=1 Tax=Lentithecium fluviatile CBS 122367 TaxID=1168545 RepID=A0A6G1IMR9_9PLEO|nr:cytochrome P450 [Lentithecium fluviatile CBS 122367]